MLNKKDNPWPGLAAYNEPDSRVFFGRDEELKTVLTAIERNLNVVLFGESGSGKTSLLRAGLTPLLIKQNYLPISIRLDHNCNEDYCSQIETAIRESIRKRGCVAEALFDLDIEKFSSKSRLWMLLYGTLIWKSDNSRLMPVLLLDQFEEIFTQTRSRTQMKSFFDDIAELSQVVPSSEVMEALELQDSSFFPTGVSNIRFVYSLREDFLGDLENNSGACSLLFQKKIGLKKLNICQAREIIVRSLKHDVSEDVVDGIIASVIGSQNLPANLSEPVVDPSILSLCCSKLFDKAAEEGMDRLSIGIIKSSDDIIYSHYKESIVTLPPRSIDYLEKAFLTINGYRKKLYEDDRDKLLFPGNVITHLLQCRILRKDVQRARISYELMHDVLCASVIRYRAETNKDSKRISRLVKGCDILLSFYIVMRILTSPQVLLEMFQAPVWTLGIVCIFLGAMMFRLMSYEISGANRMVSIGATCLTLLLFIFTPASISGLFSGRLVLWFILIVIYHCFSGLLSILLGKRVPVKKAFSILVTPNMLLMLKLFSIGVIAVILYDIGAFKVYSQWGAMMGLLVLSWLVFTIFFRVDVRKVKWYTLLGLISVLLAGAYLLSFKSSIYTMLITTIACVSMIVYGRSVIPKYEFEWLLKTVAKVSPVLPVGIMIGIIVGPIILVLSLSFGYWEEGRGGWANCFEKNPAVVIPQDKLAYGKNVIWSYDSMKTVREHTLFVTRNDENKVGLYHSCSYILPPVFDDIDRVVTYVPLKENADGTIVLSEYFATTWVKEDNDTMRSQTTSLCQYMYTCNHIVKEMLDEAEKYCHSSASAIRKVQYYEQCLKHEEDMIFGRYQHRKYERELIDAKCQVLINRMKEYAIAAERDVLDWISVNDICETLKRGYEYDGLSQELKDKIEVLNHAGESPSVVLDKIWRAQNAHLGLGDALSENLDVFIKDPLFSELINDYSLCVE